MNRFNRKVTILLAAACLAMGLPESYAATPPAPTRLAWPRDFTLPSGQLEMYQPQIETWNGNRIAGRAAVAIGAKDSTPTYGVVRFSAMADIDKASGLVQLTQIHLDSVDVPTNPAASEQVRQAVLADIPSKGLTVSLDQLQTSYAASQQLSAVQHVDVKNDVPRIVFASSPTLLVLVDGAPVTRPVGGTSFQRVMNTRELLLQDASGRLYLRAAGFWYAASSANGPWLELSAPPQALLAAASKAEAGNDKADPMLPADGKRAAKAPAVLIATEPTELVLTDGPQKLTPVDGISLLTVANSDHAVFVDPKGNETYVLISGRWFRAKSESGPWEYVAGNQLPPDFAKISPHDPKANVLVSVPGTPQAKEAAIASTIPQTAAVSRAKASMAVSYDGAPQFKPVQGTSLSYAVNTGTPVIEVDSAHYYAVYNGVWFVASAPTGAWHVAAEVPGVIYTIPVSSPLHYVTYVRIYSVTPDTVVVGYTPGYMGVVVGADGTVVYGTGYTYVPYVGTAYYPYPATYGYGAGFALSAAEGFAFGFAVGAIWGAAAPYWGPYWGGGWHYSNVNVNQANFYGRWG